MRRGAQGPGPGQQCSGQPSVGGPALPCIPRLPPCHGCCRPAIPPFSTSPKLVTHAPHQLCLALPCIHSALAASSRSLPCPAHSAPAPLLAYFPCTPFQPTSSSDYLPFPVPVSTHQLLSSLAVPCTHANPPAPLVTCCARPNRHHVGAAPRPALPPVHEPSQLLPSLVIHEFWFHGEKQANTGCCWQCPALRSRRWRWQRQRRACCASPPLIRGLWWPNRIAAASVVPRPSSRAACQALSALGPVQALSKPRGCCAPAQAAGPGRCTQRRSGIRGGSPGPGACGGGGGGPGGPGGSCTPWAAPPALPAAAARQRLLPEPWGRGGRPSLQCS